MKRDSQDVVPTVLALDQISGITSSLNNFAYVMFRGINRLLLHSGMTVTKESVSPLSTMSLSGESLVRQHVPT